MKLLLKKIKSMLVMVLAFTFVAALTLSSCGGNKAESEDAEETTEHPAEDAASESEEHPASEEEHPASEEEHPSDSTASEE